MRAAIYRHGPPPTISALADLLHEDAEAEVWRMYMAEMSRAVAMKITRNSRIKSYREIVHPEKAPKAEKTGDEIFAGIIAQALGGTA